MQSKEYSIPKLTSLSSSLLVHLYKLQFEDENNMKQENYYFFTFNYYSITAGFQITADLLKMRKIAIGRIFSSGITIPFLLFPASYRPFSFLVANPHNSRVKMVLNEDENNMKQEKYYFFTLNYYSITGLFPITTDRLKIGKIAIGRTFSSGITIPL